MTARSDTWGHVLRNPPTKKEVEEERFMRALEEGRAKYCGCCGAPFYVAVGHDCEVDR